MGQPLQKGGVTNFDIKLIKEIPGGNYNVDLEETDSLPERVCLRPPKVYPTRNSTSKGPV